MQCIEMLTQAFTEMSLSLSVVLSIQHLFRRMSCLTAWNRCFSIFIRLRLPRNGVIEANGLRFVNHFSAYYLCYFQLVSLMHQRNAKNLKEVKHRLCLPEVWRRKWRSPTFENAAILLSNVSVNVGYPEELRKRCSRCLACGERQSAAQRYKN